MKKEKMSFKNIVNQNKDKYLSEMIKIRRKIHRNPELGFQEKQTSDFIVNYLQKAGINKLQKNIGKTGVTALIEGENIEKTLGIRADMDALPIEEKTGLDYSSQNKGVMHACGHDGHIAMLLILGKILNENKDLLKHNIKLIFQPGEEMKGGAKHMIEDGVLEGDKKSDISSVDAIIALHLWPDFPTGTVGIKEGPTMAAMEKFDITILGEGAHGARPHEGINPITIGNQIGLSLHTIISERINPAESAVISIGEFQGGKAYNVIPDKIEMKGTIRTINKSTRQKIVSEIKQRAKYIGRAYGAEINIDIEKLYPLTINNKKIVNMLRKNKNEIKLKELRHPSLGSEDFAFFLQKIPGAIFLVGANLKNKNYPLHHSKFNFDEKALLTGLKVFIYLVDTDIFESVS
ncbi:MAG: M20 metallopeptidase family protein [Halanaerobiales bacterium]